MGWVSISPKGITQLLNFWQGKPTVKKPLIPSFLISIRGIDKST